jgi:hypothetical protein
MTLYWENNDNSEIDKCDGDLVIAHYNGTDWETLGAGGGYTGSCGTGDFGTVKVLNVSDFSPFSFGSGGSGNNPLPIELLSFTAEPNGSVVDLDWETASETNNDFFTIERADNAINFEAIANTSGAGNSSIALSYSMVDFNPLMGVSYYRLKQTDYDGKYEYSDVVAVTFTGDEKGEPSIMLSPNPTNGDKGINVLLSNYPTNATVTISLHDNLGKIIYTNTIQTDINGIGELTIHNSSGFASGMYYLNAHALNVNQSETLLITKY